MLTSLDFSEAFTILFTLTRSLVLVLTVVLVLLIVFSSLLPSLLLSLTLLVALLELDPPPTLLPSTPTLPSSTAVLLTLSQDNFSMNPTTSSSSIQRFFLFSDRNSSLLPSTPQEFR